MLQKRVAFFKSMTFLFFTGLTVWSGPLPGILIQINLL